MQAKIGPNTQKMLENRLKMTKTRANKDCAGFLVTENKEKVRLPVEDIVEISKRNSGEEILDSEQASKLIVEEAQKEEGKPEIRRKVIQDVKEAMDKLEESIRSSVALFKKELNQILEKAPKEDANKFGKLLSSLKDVSFDLELDNAFSKLAEERNDPRKQMEFGIFEKLSETLDKIQDDFKKKAEELREKSRKELLRVDFGKKFKENMKEIKGIDLGSVEEIPKVKGKEEICQGERGISVKPGDPSQFLVLSKEGPLLFFDEKKQEAKEIKLEAKQKFFFDSVFFSPNGSHFLTSIYFDLSVSVFDSNSFDQVASWNQNGIYGGVSITKWIDDRRILAGFIGSGALEVYELGSKKPIVTINPLSLTGIDQFDVDGSRTIAVCSAYFKEKKEGPKIIHLFKVEITKSHESVSWEHQRHNDTIDAIRIFNSGDFVISGGNDNHLVVTGMKDGKVLMIIDWVGQYVKNIVFSPDEKVLLVQSFLGVSLLSCEGTANSSLAFKEIQKVSSDLIGGKSLNYSMTVVWDYSPDSNNHFLLLGKQDGTVAKAKLK